MHVRLHAEAEAEIDRAVDYYDRDSETAGESFESELWRIIESLQRFPRSGTPLFGRARRRAMRRFPYSILYTVQPDHVYIFAVAHFKRRWGYWLKRLE